MSVPLLTDRMRYLVGLLIWIYITDLKETCLRCSGSWICLLCQDPTSLIRSECDEAMIVKLCLTLEGIVKSAVKTIAAQKNP